MAMENPVSLIGSSGTQTWPIGKDAASFTSSTRNATAKEWGLLLQGQSFHGNRNFAAPNRSGSAPPSMEGSSLAIGDLRKYHNSSLEGIFENLSTAVETSESEEQLRADPAYHAYYYSNVNLNPRLPQPLVSRDNRGLVHHIGQFGESQRMSSFDDSSKIYSMSRPALSTHKEEYEGGRSPRLGSDRIGENNSGFVSGQYSASLQGQHKSLVDLIQEDFPRTPSPVYNNQSCLSSHGNVEQADPDSCVNPLHESSVNISKAESEAATVGARGHISIPRAHSVGSSSNDLTVPLITYACSDVTLNPHPGKTSTTFGGKLNNGISPIDTSLSIGNIENGTKSLRISNDGDRDQPHQHPQQGNLHTRGSSTQAHLGQAPMVHQGMTSSSNAVDQNFHGQHKLPSAVHPIWQSAGDAPPLYATAAACGNTYYPNVQPSSLFPSQFGIGGYTFNSSLVSPFITGYPPYTAIHRPFESSASPNFVGRTSGISGGNITPVADVQQLHKFYGQFGVATQPSFLDPNYIPYFQHPSIDTYASQYDTIAYRGSPPGNYDPQRWPLLAPRPPEQSAQIVRSGAVNILGTRKGGTVTPNHSGSPQNVAVLLHYPSSPLDSPVFQGSPVAGGRRNENMRFQVSSGRIGGAFSGWQGQRGFDKADDQKTHSFLEELKSNKSRKYELSDIAGRIVEFSADQHGSRFIQQKLEICNAEEKASVFEEVLPHASTLMIDVFGNYVIQKFFEHGNPVQRKELANKLVGQILSLSLQMYGCRVIQKALEVIELDQKTLLVHELDGHVMRCVRDQNGNHVIQKCIECLPTERIGFIISSFHGNVATLSMHPYGCRVIQRVLEHCGDELQSHCIIEEILQSACVLAQDQYGNYVTQHVLERGRPLERSQIITKLAGQIVQMSQHKFASNVIEKCVEHGSSEERDLLIGEIVEQTEGNDNLLVMMKDQYANYVVQKILETCNDNQQAILLDHIKVHLQALKKYTYGKHIVARVEQLCGEDPHASES